MATFPELFFFKMAVIYFIGELQTQEIFKVEIKNKVKDCKDIIKDMFEKEAKGSYNVFSNFSKRFCYKFDKLFSKFRKSVLRFLLPILQFVFHFFPGYEEKFMR